MNGTEQTNHRTVTSQLRREFDAASTETTRALHVCADRLRAHDRDAIRLEKAINDERTHRLRLADEQRGYVDARDNDVLRAVEAVNDRATAFVSRGFWSRLNWLLTGR